MTAYKYIGGGVGWVSTILATAVAFAVGYWSIAWLLKFVAGNDFSLFIRYRIGLGVIIMLLLMTGAITAI